MTKKQQKQRQEKRLQEYRKRLEESFRRELRDKGATNR